MSDYQKKRIEYINNWPDVEPFSAEAEYQKRCESFTNTYHKRPLNLLKMWDIDEEKVNRLLSHLLETLDMMPLHPNWAFTFLFTALDYYCSELYQSNSTANLKSMTDDLTAICDSNEDVLSVMQTIFSAVPPSLCIYMYENFYKDSENKQVITRVTTESNTKPNSERKALLEAVFAKYGYDPTHYPASIRNASMLYRKIFMQDSIELLTDQGKSTLDISVKTKFHLLVSGILYTLRNDSAHGSSMATTKSSLTSPKRYASNYYSYLAVYTILMLLVISNSDLELNEKNEKYKELRSVTDKNIEDFKNLFGNHIK